MEITTIPALYKVDVPSNMEQGFSWVNSSFFIDFVREVDDMNHFFICETKEDTGKAIELIKLFNTMKVNVNTSLLSEEQRNDNHFLEDFEEIDCKSALSFDSMRNKCCFATLYELKDHITIPPAILQRLEKIN